MYSRRESFALSVPLGNWECNYCYSLRKEFSQRVERVSCTTQFLHSRALCRAVGLFSAMGMYGDSARKAQNYLGSSQKTIDPRQSEIALEKAYSKALLLG